MALLELAGIAAPVLGGIVGNIFAGKSESERNAILSQIVGDIDKLQTPEQKGQKIAELQQIGILTPELEKAVQLGDTELAKISIDPSYKAAQTRALSKLEEIGTSGGMTAEDVANLNAIKNKEMTTARGAREAALQNMAARGIGGSGLELALSAGANQAAAQRMSQQDLDVAGMAQKRALDAIQQAGVMGGQMRGQEYGEQSNLASARDAIAKYNTGLMSEAAQRNLAAKNEAQKLNLGTAQSISNQNITNANAQIQQNYENELNKQRAKAQAMGGQAQAAGDTAQRQANMWSGIGTGLGTGLLGYSQYGEKKKRSV